MVAIEHLLGERLAAGYHIAQGVEKTAFIVSGSVELGSLAQPCRGNFENFLRQVANISTARNRSFERELWHGMAKALALLDRPMLDPVPCGIERRPRIEQPDPQRW